MIDNQQNIIFRIPKISRIHWILFLLTIFTTLLAGAMMEGALVFSKPLEILKGIHKSLDDSASKAVMKLPKFTPASQRGKPVKLKYTIPVNFKLR